MDATEKAARSELAALLPNLTSATVDVEARRILLNAHMTEMMNPEMKTYDFKSKMVHMNTLEADIVEQTVKMDMMRERAMFLMRTIRSPERIKLMQMMERIKSVEIYLKTAPVSISVDDLTNIALDWENVLVSALYELSNQSRDCVYFHSIVLSKLKKECTYVGHHHTNQQRESTCQCQRLEYVIIYVKNKI